MKRRDNGRNLLCMKMNNNGEKNKIEEFILHSTIHTNNQSRVPRNSVMGKEQETSVSFRFPVQLLHGSQRSFVGSLEGK